MQAEALKRWDGITQPLEGRVLWMYVDTKGYVTTGDGNLIDSPAAAARLPWKRPDGSLASYAEVERDWNAIKRSGLEATGGGSAQQAAVTSLRLTHEDVNALVASKIAENETVLRKRWPGYDKAPAEAQLALNLWAWAVGPAAKYPALFTALSNEAYSTAGKEALINPQVGTIGAPQPWAPKRVRNRNTIIRELFDNADAVARAGGDRSLVLWPERISEGLSMPVAGVGSPTTKRVAMGACAAAIGYALYHWWWR